MTRRELGGVLAGAAAFHVRAAAADKHGFIKGICSIIFPDGQPISDSFAQAKKAGFDAMELRVGADIPLDSSAADLQKTASAARQAGITIATLWVSEPLSKNPLNSDSPESRGRGVAAIVQSVSLAHQLGCGALLLYPGRLGSGARLDVGYETTWERFTAELKKAIPAAEKAKVYLDPENVWNKFLVSPLEMRSFVDQFHNPWLQTHFDIGNVMQFGYPQDWILTLGSRIKRVHVKDYKLSARAEQGRFVDLLEGDVDWKAVMAALVKTGYKGFLSPEISHDPKQPDQLRQVSQQLDRIISMA
ncbi:MAG: sugar phosphate isomerase/epimerase family protein [Bryobacteraceae bacterium]